MAVRVRSGSPMAVGCGCGIACRDHVPDFRRNRSQTIDTKDGLQILNGNNVEYAQIVDNTQQVKLKLKSDYSATD